MFTFAQYVLGIGKSIDERPIENNTNTITNANSAANSNSKDCSLTNIENDWILINNVDENEQSDPIKVDKIVQKQSNHASNKKAIKNSGQESSSPSVQRSSLSKNENQLTANVNSKKCQQNNQQEQTNSSLQTEKLDNEQLIEERIFDNLFVKKPPFTVPLFPVKSEQAKKLIFLKIKNSANNKNFGNKENLPLNRSKRNNKNNNKNGTENLVNTGRSSASLTLNTSSKNGKETNHLFLILLFP